MNMGVLLAVGAGLLSALPLGAQSGLLLAVISPLPLFMIGLSQGVQGIAIAGFTACVLNGLLAGLLGALSTFLVLAGPVALLVRQALLNRASQDGTLEWYPPGLLVMWLSAIGAVWLVLAFAILGSGPEGIQATVRSDVETALTIMMPQMEGDALVRLRDTMSIFAIGAGLLAWLIVMAINGILAQGVLLRFRRALRPAPDIRRIELPRWLDIALALVVAAAVLGSGDFSYVATNLTLVLLLPYLFVGLALVHFWVGRTGAAAPIILVVFYPMLVFGWLLPIVVGLGLVEQLVGFRRMSTAGPDQEDE